MKLLKKIDYLLTNLSWIILDFYGIKCNISLSNNVFVQTIALVMPRPVWKGPFFRLSLLNQVSALRRDSVSTSSLTTARSSTILPEMVGITLNVHNGKDYIPLTIREEMVGRLLGQFVACKKPFTFRQTNAGKKSKK